jgi:hypothetical protein
MYECYKCGREFSKAEGLSKHVKSCVGKRYCKQCGIETKNPKFCSSSCAETYNNTQYLLETKKEEAVSYELSAKPYFELSIHDRKEILWLEQKHKCLTCEFDLYDPINVPYEIYHVDGNDTNKQRSNEQLLCCNCYNMKPNYRFKGIKHTKESKKIKKKMLTIMPL